jgi:hypothetical protein
MEKDAKNGRKVKSIALLFCRFSQLFQKLKKVAENRRKGKAIALLFCCFLPIYEK